MRFLASIPSPNGSNEQPPLQASFPASAEISMARFGTVLFIVVEAMLFAGLISAFLSMKATLPWPPLDQPRYPVGATAISTVILLASGLSLYLFRRNYSREQQKATILTILMVGAILLGTAFLVFQGIEWAKLINYGLTVKSSTYGSIFYVIIGVHAVHALGGLLWLASSSAAAITNNFSRGAASLEASGLFWYFVVLVWPFLYGVVYF